MDNLFVFIFGLILFETQINAESREQICSDPRFDAALAVPDLQDNSKYSRYLFRGQSVLPYIRVGDRNQIDWSNIVPISSLFPTIAANKVVILAFHYWYVSGLQVYISVKDVNIKDTKPAIDTIYAFNVKQVNGKTEFQTPKTVDWKAITNQAFGWQITTAIREPKGDKPLSTRHQYFVDSTSYGNGKGWTDKLIQLFATEFKFSYNYPEYEPAYNFTDQILVDNKISPDVFIFINQKHSQIKIPIEFDAYYQVFNVETVFFKGWSACIDIHTDNKWQETNFCRSWIDTRTIIGCFDPDINVEAKGPEFDPNEPQDIDKDF